MSYFSLYVVAHPGQLWNLGAAMWDTDLEEISGSFAVMESYFDPFVHL